MSESVRGSRCGGRARSGAREADGACSGPIGAARSPRDSARRAEEILQETLGERSLEVGVARANLALALCLLGDTQPAAQAAEGALAPFRAEGGDAQAAAAADADALDDDGDAARGDGVTATQASASGGISFRTGGS